MVKNYTGHTVRFVDSFGNVVKEIADSGAVRAKTTKMDLPNLEGVIKVRHLSYSLDITTEWFEKLEREAMTEGIIVSKIVAECLRKQGFRSPLYITGAKKVANNGQLGVISLCLF